MKKLTAIAVTAVLAAFLCCGGAQARDLVTVRNVIAWEIAEGNTPNVPQYGMLAKNVNLRASPGKDGVKVGTVSDSRLVSLYWVYLTGDNTPWHLCWVEDQHRLAWVYYKFIKMDYQNGNMFANAFNILMNADLAVSDAELDKAWGPGAPKVKKWHDKSLGVDLTSRSYDKLQVTLFEPEQQGGRRTVQSAVTSKTGGGFGSLFVGVKWCNRKFVKEYLGQPKDAQQDDKVWNYTGGDGFDSLAVEFAPDDTIRSLEFNHHVDYE